METFRLTGSLRLAPIFALAVILSPVSLASHDGLRAAERAEANVTGALIGGTEVSARGADQPLRTRTAFEAAQAFQGTDRNQRIEQLRIAYLRLREGGSERADQFYNHFIVAGNNYERVTAAVERIEAPSGEIETRLADRIDQFSLTHGSLLSGRLSRHLTSELQQLAAFEQQSLEVTEFDIQLSQRLIEALESGAFTDELDPSQQAALIRRLSSEIERSRRIQVAFRHELGAIHEILVERDQASESAEDTTLLGERTSILTSDRSEVAVADHDRLHRAIVPGEVSEVHLKALRLR
jgi:hypothetical protein